MSSLHAAVVRALRRVAARPGRAFPTVFGVGLGVAAALALLTAADAGRWDAADLRASAAAPVRVVAGDRESEVRVIAVTPDSIRRAGLEVAEGRLLADLDLRDARRVAVLGAGARAELFGFRPALFRPIEIAEARFMVVGVLAPTAASDALPHGSDADRAVYLPASAARAQRAALLPDEAGPRVPVVGRAHHRVAVFVASALFAVSLGASALGQAMAASVAERRRELALRRVVGATRRDLFAEVLLESIGLGLVGGVAGTALGLALAALDPELTGFEVPIALWSAPWGLALGALVGAAAGLRSALRASHLDPVRALRE